MDAYGKLRDRNILIITGYFKTDSSPKTEVAISLKTELAAHYNFYFQFETVSKIIPIGDIKYSLSDRIRAD